MKEQTRTAVNNYFQNQAVLNHTTSQVVRNEKYSVDPAITQKLEEKIAASNDFLGKIGTIFVDEQQGEKVGIDVGSPVASTTDTSGNGTRTTSDPTTMAKDSYHCQQINYDTHISYAKLDQWAGHPSFQTKFNSVITKQIARDDLMIGFNGTKRSATSDKASNPLLQDVAAGWLQKIRDKAPEQHQSRVKLGDAAGADYKNLDAMIYEATHELLAQWYRDDNDLVLICNSSLISEDVTKILGQIDRSSDYNVINQVLSSLRVGGLRPVIASFFPEEAFLITKLDNLNRYIQKTSTRRANKNTIERDRFESFLSMNKDFIVEDYKAAAFIENIEAV